MERLRLSSCLGASACAPPTCSTGKPRRRRSGALPFCLRALRVLRARPAVACRGARPKPGSLTTAATQTRRHRSRRQTRTATRFRLAAQAWTRSGLAWEPRRPIHFPHRTPPGSRPLRRPIPAPPPDGTPAGFAAHRHRGRSTSQGSARGARHPWAAGRKPVGLGRLLPALCSWLNAPPPQDPRPSSGS
jgi:hypothetical protein